MGVYKIIIKVLNEVVTITTENTQYGGGEVIMESKITGENNEIALNSQFLLNYFEN